MGNTIAAFVLIGLLMGLAYWLGYRTGHRNGVAVWRKSYRYMTPKDIETHKGIIKAMEQPSR